MNLLSKKTMSLLFVTSMLFANGLAMEREQTLEEQLCAACSNGHTKVVKELLLKHPKIDVNKVVDNLYKRTPLNVACLYGHTEVVKELLKHPKIDVNKKNWCKFDLYDWDDVEWTSLHIACCFGCLGAVRALLAFGADFRITDNEDKTASDIARGKNNREVIKAIKDPLVTAVCEFGVCGVRIYLKMRCFYFYERYCYEVDGKMLKLLVIDIARLELKETETKIDESNKKFSSSDEKRMELEKAKDKMKKIIEMLELPQFDLMKILRKAAEKGVYVDCIVKTKKP